MEKFETCIENLAILINESDYERMKNSDIYDDKLKILLLKYLGILSNNESENVDKILSFLCKFCYWYKLKDKSHEDFNFIKDRIQHLENKYNSIFDNENYKAIKIYIENFNTNFQNVNICELLIKYGVETLNDKFKINAKLKSGFDFKFSIHYVSYIIGGFEKDGTYSINIFFECGFVKGAIDEICSNLDDQVKCKTERNNSIIKLIFTDDEYFIEEYENFRNYHNEYCVKLDILETRINLTKI